jgi:histidine ammonia-lyase
LFAAVRALQMAPDRVAGTRLQPVFDRLVALIDDSTDDRPLGPDIERMEAELPTLGSVLVTCPAR